MSEKIISIGAKAFSEEQIKLTLPSYENLKMQIEEIRSNAELYRKVKDKENKQFNNTIGIFGERGTGKTSVAYTIINSLEKGKDIILPIIEPDTYGKSTTILGVILKFLKDEMDKLLKEIKESNMKDINEFEDFFRDCAFKENNPLKVKYNEILEYFSYKDDLYREVMLTSYTDMTSYKKKYSYILAPDYAFKEKIRDFIDRLIEVKRKLNEEKEPLIIILVDDIDLKTSKCKELIEALMAYTCHANVVCLLLGDYEILGESLALALLGEEEIKLEEYQEKAIFRDIYESLAERKRYLSDEYLKKILPPAFRHSVVKWNKENIPNFKFNEDGETLKELLNEALKEENIFLKNIQVKQIDENTNNIEKQTKVKELIMNSSYEIFDKTARGLVNAYYSLNKYVSRIRYIEKIEDEEERNKIDIFYLKKSLIDSFINSSSELIKLQKSIYDKYIIWGNNEENTILNFRGEENLSEDKRRIFLLLELTRNLLNQAIVKEKYILTKNKYLYDIGKDSNLNMLINPEEGGGLYEWRDNKYESKMWDGDKGIFNELIYNSKLDNSIILIKNLDEYRLIGGNIRSKEKMYLFENLSIIIFTLNEKIILREMYEEKQFYKKTLEFLEGYSNEKRNYDFIRRNIENDFEKMRIVGSYIPISEKYNFNVEYDNIIFNTILLVREALSEIKSSQKIVEILFSDTKYNVSNEIKGLKESLVDIRVRKKLEDSLNKKTNKILSKYEIVGDKKKVNEIFENNTNNVFEGIFLNKEELIKILGTGYEVRNGYNTILYRILNKLKNEITIVEYVEIVVDLKYHIYVSKSIYGKKEARAALYYLQNNTYVKDKSLTYQDIRLILEYIEYMGENDIKGKKIGIERIETLKERMRESLKNAEEEAIKEEMKFNDIYGIIGEDDEEGEFKKENEEKILIKEGLNENEQ